MAAPAGEGAGSLGAARRARPGARAIWSETASKVLSLAAGAAAAVVVASLVGVIGRAKESATAVRPSPVIVAPRAIQRPAGDAKEPHALSDSEDELLDLRAFDSLLARGPADEAARQLVLELLDGFARDTPDPKRAEVLERCLRVCRRARTPEVVVARARACLAELLGPAPPPRPWPDAIPM